MDSFCKGDYLRIGTQYYKRGRVPLHSGDYSETLLPWSKGEIITDMGKDFLDTIEKYDGFCSIPDHKNYKQVIKNFYNKYEKLEHQFEKGDFPLTETFLQHIFSEQYDLGIDYLTILWQKPTQILPILCLVSEDRKTGKTTFLNWLKLLFQGNMTINKNEDFRSRFNSDWSSKLIVAVDEVLLDKKEDSERIKNLSTAVTYKTESKGVDKVESYFFGKFILCSNNEDNFIQVDSSEIRYWVRKVPVLRDENENPDLLEELKKELPCFLEFIDAREISVPKKTRMWFDKRQIYTEALRRLVKGNKTYLNKEIEHILFDDFIRFEVDILEYSATDLCEMLKRNNVFSNSFKVSEVLKKDYGLESKNSTYTKYFLNKTNDGKFTTAQEKCKGRHFVFKREDFAIEMKSN